MGRGGRTGWTRWIQKQTLRKEKLKIWGRGGGLTGGCKDYDFGLGVI